MATCPHCRRSSRKVSDLMTLEPVLHAKPIGDFSLAGHQMKFSVVQRMKLSCLCGWSVEGVMDGDYLEADPTSEVWPA